MLPRHSRLLCAVGSMFLLGVAPAFCQAGPTPTPVAPFEKEAQRLAKTWYPKIRTLLGVRSSAPQQKFEIVFDYEKDGVAYASGDRITVMARWVQAHPDDIGLVVHELTHVVQAYPPGGPGWLVEGIADHVRWFCYEPANRRPRPNPNTARYDASYQTSAAFLDWVVRTYDRNIIRKLDAALKEGKYSPEIFRRSTGKSLDELGARWVESLKKS